MKKLLRWMFPKSRRRRVMDAYLEIYGLEQVRGLTLEQAVFARRFGLIEPIVDVEEIDRILRENGLM